MKTFKEFVSKTTTKGAGLDHPMDDRSDDNEPRVGKDLNSIKVPLEVHNEFKGPQGKSYLKAKEGKYSLEKGAKKPK